MENNKLLNSEEQKQPISKKQKRITAILMGVVAVLLLLLIIFVFICSIVFCILYYNKSLSGDEVMIKISQEQLFSFAKKHNLIEPGLKKNREQLLLNFVKTIRSMDKETYEKAKYIEVNREKFTKDEAMILVMLVKNIQAYNDFCEGEYLSSKKHKSSGSLRKLFHEAIRYKDVNEFLLNYPLLTQRMEILEKLETFRTYFASPVEKEQYDEWKRKVEPCYRKTRAYIGSEALEAYLKKDEDPDLLFQFMIRYQYTSIMTIKEYISQYLPFCKTDVQQQIIVLIFMINV